MSTSYEKLLDKAYALIPDNLIKEERFEVPVVSSFTQGNKTIIRNFDFIAETLRRDRADIIKFLSKELAVPASPEGKRLVLAGRFNEKMLNDRIMTFTKTYVLCKECKKPDTKLIDAGRGVKVLSCEACGAKSPVRIR
ncbi:MAG: translation initiation factor IF-2 subunit beta [Candidatus Micrarchaeota archaeon]